ncbi:MAG: type I DNA topoisomerase [Tissierellia bacterium]|nr:type I DNA topoisomerase [Tissierellia bacterium]MDD4725623.1 type I DNA topoisomerase [Tissierellia bacterium]
MAKYLVIVESPAKSRTIEKILGKNYKVVASVGHVRDLPKSALGIDIENNFDPKYITIRGKGPVIKDLKKEAKKCEKIFLATDPDREGEAISWHLAHILDLDKSENIRIEFNEITKEAVKTSIKNPRSIDIDLVDAQQARRILDRLVGYKISPLLWKKVRKGLSAGRVQSVTVKLICDREEEIDSFIPKEYWTIKANLLKGKEGFESNFIGKIINNKEEKIEINNEEEVNCILNSLDKENFRVSSIKRGKRKRNPYPPYTTSTLQQDASKKLNFSTKKTMGLAQQLYEGIDLKKGGITGLITYMRTDSTRISNEAISLSKEFIINNYGKEYSNGGKTYGNRSKKETQDAHEGVRPTNITLTPDNIKEYLSRDQFKLYKLIWDRFIGSQMKEAQYDTISANIVSNDYLFRATGSKLVFPGFLKVYITTDEEVKDMDIPDLNEGDLLKVKEIIPKQNFTQPPARYTEASLIKMLEELGIGRPSTYAPTITTILSRNYVVLEKKQFYPTDLGKIVNDILIEYFSNIINEEFTANLENQLDDIALGNVPWKNVVSQFYDEFHKYLIKAEKEVEEIEIKDEETDIICEKCGRNMVIKNGRYGKFLACPGYPECKNTKPILDKIGVKCPKCDGDIVKKRSKKGRNFYGCSNYPDCDFVSWDEPIEEKCPNCREYMIIKRNKTKSIIKCSNKECGYTKAKE